MASRVDPGRRRGLPTMLELIDELRRRDFTISVTTGGGTEFVRAVSRHYHSRSISLLESAQ